MIVDRAPITRGVEIELRSALAIDAILGVNEARESKGAVSAVLGVALARRRVAENPMFRALSQCVCIDSLLACG